MIYKSFTKIFVLLTFKEKFFFFLLLLLSFFSALFETIGVVSILPLMYVVVSPETYQTNSTLNFLSSLIFKDLNLNTIEFKVFLGLSSILIIIISTGLKIYAIYLQYKFCLNFEYILGKKFFSEYLNQDYKNFLEEDSTKLKKNILYDVNRIMNSILIPQINFISHSGLVFFLVIVIFIFNPNAALYVGFFLIFIFVIIYFFFKNYLTRIGNQVFKLNETRFGILNEAFEGLKEIKVRGTEDNYILSFKQASKLYARSQTNSYIIGILPKHLIEAISISSILIFILILINRNESLIEIIPIISLYIFAGYKLIPALNLIYFSATQIKYHFKILTHLCDENLKFKSNFIKHFINTKDHDLKFEKFIQFKDISFQYSKKRKIALRNINATIPIFSKIGIIGPTGSGKTTFLDILLGLLKPTEGKLLIDDTLINELNIKNWQKKIGYVSQDPFLFNNTISENIVFSNKKDDINYEKLIYSSKIANLHEFIEQELPDKYETVIGDKGIQLSGGQRQRIAIARALYKNNDVIIFDEATSGLDNLTEAEILNTIQSLKNKTIIFVTHRVNTVRNCDIIFLIDKGLIKKVDNFNELIKLYQLYSIQ